MKPILLCLSFAVALQVANAQWNGVFTYTDNYDEGPVSEKAITIISESAGKGRIDSKTYPTKSYKMKNKILSYHGRPLSRHPKGTRI